MVLDQLVFTGVFNELSLDCVDDLTNTADEKFLKDLWVESGAYVVWGLHVGDGGVDVLALPVQLLDDFDVLAFVDVLLLGVVEVD